MKPLHDYLADTLIRNSETGKLPRGVTPLEWQTLIDIDRRTRNGEMCETILQTVADICRKHGMEVTEEGIGWTVASSARTCKPKSRKAR